MFSFKCFSKYFKINVDIKTRKRIIRILLRGNSNEQGKLSSTYFAPDDE
ncbi:MAG: hypothetical protein ACI952_001549, partial [Flavobacteriales bacterium]